MNAGLSGKSVLYSRIVYLSNIIENGKISPSETKVDVVMSFLQPKSVKQLQNFLGLSGYFRKFIVNYSTFARPLTDLLRDENDFVFRDVHVNAFNQLKQMAQALVLALFRQGECGEFSNVIGPGNSTAE